VNGALLQDLKHSIRMFRQSAGFTFAAVAALALGIGANVAIFSVVNAVLLKPAPFPDPDRLVLFQNTSPQGTGQAASPAKFAHWSGLSDIVQDAAAFRSGVVNYTGGEAPEQFSWAQVSTAYFRLFGAPVLRGRTFSAEEDLPGGPLVAVISHGLWVRRFAEDPDLVGRTVLLSGDPHVVIGILDPSFDASELGPAPDVWTPFQLDSNSTDQGHYFRAGARLKAGVELERARARMLLAADEYDRKFPDAIADGWSFSLQPIREAIVSNVRSSLLVLVGAVSLVLLIACANVANLLLARAADRKREIAIRAALGAGRGRIIRQLVTESVLLSLAGGVAGLALGIVGIRALLSVNTAGLPRVGQDGAMVSLDWRVLAFTVFAATATGILFGLIPALQSSRADLGATIKESGSRSGSGMRQNKARSALMVSEIALALVLLVGSALLIRTSMELGRVNPGFDATSVLTLRMSLTGPRFLTSSGVEQLVRAGAERIEALPGVVRASATCCVPLQGGYSLPFVVAGRPLEGPSHGGGPWSTPSPGLFEVFDIPIKRGRAFTPRDDEAGPPVVLINETMAQRYWPDSDPLDDRLIIGRGIMREYADEPERQIIGIVGDVRDGGLNNDPRPHMYVPQAQVPDAANALNVRIMPIAWVVRTQVDPHSLQAEIEEVLRQASGLPVANVTSMQEVVTRSTSRQRFNMWLMSTFGACALLLAAIGIYGLMAYSVRQRTQEIGIRLALGAELSQVKNMVVMQGMRLALAGVAIGLAAAFGLAQFLSSFLYGVETWDPLVFGVVPLLLSTIALFAVWLPARRASLVEPTEALRYE